jgi:hypothetical protein
MGATGPTHPTPSRIAALFQIAQSLAPKCKVPKFLTQKEHGLADHRLRAGSHCSSTPAISPVIQEISSKVVEGYARRLLKLLAKFNWSGREDLNLRPPGPELGGKELILLIFNHLSGASTVSVLLDHASLGVM